MKRWIWVIAMAPVMYGLFRLVCWADCLHSWQDSCKYDPLKLATATEYTRAAIVFWGALLTPLVVGLIAAVVVFRRRHAAHWPIPELCLATIPVVMVLALGIWSPCLGGGWLGRFLMVVIFAAQFLLGGVIVMTLLNLGACARKREWGKLVLSVLVLSVGMLFLFWWYAFIIYSDT